MISREQTKISIDPRINTITQLIGLNRLEEAESICQQVAQDKKDDPFLLHAWGLIDYMRQNYPQAIDKFKRSVTQVTNNANFYTNLGEALRRNGQIQEALAYFQEALLVDPNFPKAHLGLANTLVELKRYEQAITRFQFLIKLYPDFAPAYNYLGVMFTTLERQKEAIPLIRKAIALKENYYEAKFSLANALEKDAKVDEAMAIYRQLLEINPQDPAVHNNYSNLLRSIGLLEEAEQHLSEALKYNPNHLSAYFNRSGKALSKEVTADEIHHLERLLLDKNTKEEDRSGIHFTLAKYYDANKEYEKAFPHFEQGNNIDNRKEPYDREAQEKVNNILMSFFNREFFAQHPLFGSESETPVFIFGMPRSGTTLVEQIIASHPQARGGGELRYMSEVLQALAQRKANYGGYPAFLKHLDPIEACTFGESYVNKLETLIKDTEGVLRITDKMPSNFQLLGLIALLLPKAKLIHCRRDPMDSCFSCYTQRFTQVIVYTRQLSDLGHYYQNYERLMAHWHQELPMKILDVQYEEMVKDPEAMSRKVIDFINLDWNDACLNFHETQRQVKTASVEQIRQPIYTSSVGKWRRYQQFLDPLVEALGEYAPKNV